MRILLISSLAALLSGCLGTHYRIPKRDLVSLSQVDPNSRGQRVRVIQGFGSDEGPPPAPAVESNSVVVIHTGAPVGRAGRGRYRPSKLAAGKKEDAKALIVLAAIAGVALAATEGARYDGWAQLHPMHPVHLYGPMGEYSWVPLAQLDPQTAAWASKAWVRELEGPFRRVGRAPLNRRGWTYSMLMGGAEFLSIDGTDNPGFMGHIQFGFFPEQHLGILFDIALGWAKNSSNETIFEDRNALELQFLPISAGKFHGGLFGQGGVALRLEDGAEGEDRQGFFFGGGGIAQLELTTRLTLTARAALTRLYGRSSGDFTVGISVY